MVINLIYLFYIFSIILLGIDPRNLFYQWSCFFLSEKLSQDALEKLFGRIRQCGRTNENPQVAEFLNSTQSLRVIDSIWVKSITGNCRGCKSKSYELENINLNQLLKKRRRRSSQFAMK